MTKKYKIKKLTEALEKLTGKKVKLDENIDSRILRSILWNNGWNQYFAAQERLSKLLTPYRSVSELPAGVDEGTLKELSDKLIALAFEINKVSDTIAH